MTASHPFSWSLTALTALTVIDIVHSRRRPRREPTKRPHPREHPDRPPRAGPYGRRLILIGAKPHTDWLGDAVRLDDRGFVLTGADVPADAWPVTRFPPPFESSLPGVFAAGDVRHGSVKRVAGAVGDGSVAAGSVHQYLASGRLHPARTLTGGRAGGVTGTGRG